MMTDTDQPMTGAALADKRANLLELVEAAREIAYGDVQTLVLVQRDPALKSQIDRLDRACEKYADAVRWDDTPEDIAAALRAAPAQGKGEAFPDIGHDPMKRGAQTRDEAQKRVRDAYCRQQSGVPDQTALVWRWDIGQILSRLVHLEAFRAHATHPAAVPEDEAIEGAAKAIALVAGAKWSEDAKRYRSYARAALTRPTAAPDDEAVRIDSFDWVAVTDAIEAATDDPAPGMGWITDIVRKELKSQVSAGMSDEQRDAYEMLKQMISAPASPAPDDEAGAKVPTHLYFEDPDDDGVEVQPLSFTRMSELLDYATCYGEFDENTPNGARSKYPNMTTPMNDIRRAVIQTLKCCMGVLPDRVETAPAVVPIPSREDDHLSVAFAEIAIEQLGYTEDGPNGDTYGLNEDALCRGGALMVQYVRKNFVDNARHDQRVTELLQAVNRENGNRRALAASLRELYRTVLEIHGCFPLDNHEHRDAMIGARDLLSGGIAR